MRERERERKKKREKKRELSGRQTGKVVKIISCFMLDREKREKKERNQD